MSNKKREKKQSSSPKQKLSLPTNPSICLYSSHDSSIPLEDIPLGAYFTPSFLSHPMSNLVGFL